MIEPSLCRVAFTDKSRASTGLRAETRLGSPQAPGLKKAKRPATVVSTCSVAPSRYVPVVRPAGSVGSVSGLTGSQTFPSVEKPSTCPVGALA